MNYIKPFLYFLGIAALFLIDISSMLFFQQLFFQSVLCFFIICLFNKTTPFPIRLLPLWIASFFIHLEWFILHDSLSIASLFLLPITGLVFYLRRLLVPRAFYPPLVLLLCFALQAYLTYQITNHPLPYNAYTISAFFANMILLISNSLIW